MKYLLELSEDQIDSLSLAAEIIARVGIGQVDEINRAVSGYPTIDKGTKRQLKEQLFPELKGDSFYGITGEKTSEMSKELWDIHQVLRHFLAWKDQDNTPETRDWVKQMTVNFDEPMKTSLQDLPSIRKA